MRILPLLFSAVLAHDCFNCGAGDECSHFGACNEITGICGCPTGFGGASCKEPVCGGLPKGNKRPLREPGTSCVCDGGWSGINCNMCTSNQACEPFMRNSGEGDARCYTGGELVETNYHMCSVTNRKVHDLLGDRPAEASFSCQRDKQTCDFQLWIDSVESFFCELSECEFDGLTYQCPQIQCQCQPGELLCGKEGSIDISEWLEKSVKGPGTLKCKDNGDCTFQEPAMNQLIQYVFGDRSIELECGSSECLHYSLVPGYTTPEKPHASLGAAVWTILAALGVFAGLASAFRWLGRSSVGGGSGTGTQKPTLAGEAPIARTNPIGLCFDNIYYRTSANKDILCGVSGYVPPGHVLAILGGSGAGKTTLLDILAAKHKTGIVSGEVLLNGTVLTNDSELRRLVGFVDQSDAALIPTQTVWEHVMFSALLRLPATMSQATKELRALDTLQELGIAHLRHQLVGTGLSGGERRRLAIACELVTSPSVVLLDEPTSGLDAFNAHAVVETLVNLAKNAQRTIIFTIHQPRSNIVELFDRVMLLARGQLVFTGSVTSAEEFFENQGFKVPPNYNVADYMVDITMQQASYAEYYSDNNPTNDSDEFPHAEESISQFGANATGRDSVSPNSNNIEADNEDGDINVDADVLSDVSEECDPAVHDSPLTVDPTREWRDFAFHRAQISRSSAQAMAASQVSLEPQGLNSLVLAFRGSPQSVQLRAEIERARASLDPPPEITLSRASIPQQFMIISARLLRNLYRDPMLIITHYGISLGLGAICGFLYFDVSGNISGFQNRLGLFFFLLAVFGFSTLTSVSLFSRERLVFLRERANGYYHPAAYYAAKVLLDIIPLRLGPPLLLGIIIYPLVGLNICDGAPFVFLLVLALFNFSAAALILVIGIFFADFGVASLLGCMVNLFGILFAGLFLNQESVPKGAGWIRFLSLYHYAYEALAVNEVKYLTLTEQQFGLEIEVPGATILSAFGFDNTAVLRDVMGLVIAAVLCVVAGYVVLHKVLVERR